MKLEIKHLAPYLPYGLKGILTHDLRNDYEYCDWVTDIEIFNEGAIWELCGYSPSDLNIPLGEGEYDGFLYRNDNTYTCFKSDIKPLLRPLSHLDKEIEINGKRFLPIIELDLYHDFSFMNFSQIQENPTRYPYTIVEKLIEWHFDISGLLDAGLANEITEP
jgi:hypothetical protein